MEDVRLVDVRKYGVDASSPLWRRAFFRGVYLPFFRFCFKWLSIPALGSVDADGRFSWVENIGVVVDEEAAKAMCKGEFYRITRLPLNGELPEESVQYKGHIYPKSVVPDRYRRRTFPLTAEPVRHLAVLKDSITNLRKVAGT